MALAATVYSEPWDVNKRLNELGLEEEILVQAAQSGFAACAACTENHPPSTPGYFAWAETVRALRDRLVPRGWRRLNEANLPLVINEDRTLAISVSTGTEGTGRKDGNPCTSSAKGPRTVGVVQANHRQELLFPEMALPTPESLAVAGRATWILLIFRDRNAQELRCELSRPINITGEGIVDGWAERIMLSPTQFDGGVFDIERPGSDSGPSTPEIVVEIKKRG